jgi:SPOR domain
MADRYQDRPFSADDDNDRGDQSASAKGGSDPLAELARLIGQTDPYAMGRANQQVQPGRDQYQPPADDSPPAGPPPWMQRAARQEALPPQDYSNDQDFPSAVHPLHRYAAQRAVAEPDYHAAPPFAEASHEADPSHYDEALYGQLDPGAQDLPHDPAYPDDPYAYQDDYGDETEQQPAKRGGGMITVVVVLALAVLGTGAAFAYRTYVGSPRSGEPPIIKADTGPTKIVPTPADANAKLTDRMSAGDGTEKIVPREEAPVDVNAKSGPRVVFPPLNQNLNPPTAVAGSAPGAPPATASNGTLPNSEPRRIKTFTVSGDQANAAAVPVTAAPAPATPPAKPAAVARAATPAPAARAAAPAANAPLSLSPQADQSAPAAEPRTRMAAVNPAPAPAQIAPSAGAGGGGYLVQVSSQRNEADAQASFRALQGKFPTVLGSRAPLIKRADLGDKGVYYRAMVGPFGSPDEASQFCGSLKTAGGQCVVQRN